MNIKNASIITVLVAITATSLTLFNHFTYESKYAPVADGSENKAPYSVQEGRYDYWQTLHANAETGMVEKDDFRKALAAINAMPRKKGASILNFIEEGPDNVGGRTRAICVDANNNNIIYAGSVTGGLFKSENRGKTWEKSQGFTDAVNAVGVGEAVMSISSMDMTPDGTLYVGTGGSLVGEGDIGEGSSGSQGGEGIWVSKDNGNSFIQISGTEGWDISRITSHPTENKIYITGNGRRVTIYDPSKADTEKITVAAGPATSLTDVKVAPDGSFVIAGSSNVYLMKVKDGETEFTNITDKISTVAHKANVRFAISHEKNANNHYNVFASFSSVKADEADKAYYGRVFGIYMSPDSGANWYLIGPGFSDNFDVFRNQGNYNNTITVVQGKPNEIILGGIDLWHWRLYTGLDNPSGQWTRVSEWAASPFSTKFVHADNHEMEWDKEGNLYIGNDGGVFTYVPPFPNDVQWLAFKHLVKNYNVTQFYAMSAGPDGSMAAGAQDNGTQLNNHTGFTHQTTYEINGGDGFATEISQLDPNGIVSSIYNTQLSRSDDGGGNQSSVATPCSNCGAFVTKFTLQEIERDDDTEDFVNYVFSADTIIKAGDTYNFEYASENFSITLYGSYTNTTGTDVTFNRNDVLSVKDSVQALFALTIPTTSRGVYVTRDIWKYGQSPQWWRVTGTELGFAGTNVSALKFSKNGKHLFLGTSDGDVWRVEGIGDAYTRGEGDLVNAFNTVSADGGKYGIIDKISAPIIGVDQTNQIFTLSGDFTSKILVGSKVKVDGSSGNNRIYVVSVVNLNGTDTEVTVTTSIPSATANGQMNVYFSAPFTYPTVDFYNNTYYDAVNINNITNFKLNLIKIHDGSGYITDIAVDPNNENHALITYGRFGTNRVYRSMTAATATTTAGTFSSISGDLAAMPVYCAVIDKDDPNKIFAGTTFGLWYTEDGGTTWKENNEKFGRVPVYEIRQDVNQSNVGTQFEGAIYIATHGRGMWSTNIFLLDTEDNQPEDKQKFKSGISLYPNPANDIINVAYDLLASSDVKVNIVTIDGKIVKSLALGSKHAGRHRNNINIEDLPNGLYLLQLKTASDSKVAKFIKF